MTDGPPRQGRLKTLVRDGRVQTYGADGMDEEFIQMAIFPAQQ